MKKKPTRGGSRKGSGRKYEYGEPTKTISFRVPVSLIDGIKKYVADLLEKHRVKKPEK